MKVFFIFLSLLTQMFELGLFLPKHLQGFLPLVVSLGIVRQFSLWSNFRIFNILYNISFNWVDLFLIKHISVLGIRFLTSALLLPAVVQSAINSVVLILCGTRHWTQTNWQGKLIQARYALQDQWLLWHLTIHSLFSWFLCTHWASICM